MESVLNDYINESEQSIHKYFKLYHLAFRGLDQMGLDFFYRVQSFKLPVNPNFTAYLPTGYRQWIKVGILNDNGAIIPLGYNPNMTTFNDLLPDRIEDTNDQQSAWLSNGWGWNNNTWCNYWDGWSYTNVYGVPSGEPFVGEFKVDVENGVIILGQYFDRDYIMLECVVSPEEGTDQYLPVQFREALIAWLWWKDGKAKPVSSHMRLGSARDAKHEFFVERNNAIARWKPTRIEQKYEASQEMTRMAIKT